MPARWYRSCQTCTLTPHACCLLLLWKLPPGCPREQQPQATQRSTTSLNARRTTDALQQQKQATQSNLGPSACVADVRLNFNCCIETFHRPAIPWTHAKRAATGQYNPQQNMVDATQHTCMLTRQNELYNVQGSGPLISSTGSGWCATDLQNLGNPGTCGILQTNIMQVSNHCSSRTAQALQHAGSRRIVCSLSPSPWLFLLMWSLIHPSTTHPY